MGFQNQNVFSHENALRKENRDYFLQFLSAVSHFLLTLLPRNVTIGGKNPGWLCTLLVMSAIGDEALVCMGELCE